MMIVVMTKLWWSWFISECLAPAIMSSDHDNDHDNCDLWCSLWVTLKGISQRSWIGWWAAHNLWKLPNYPIRFRIHLPKRFFSSKIKDPVTKKKVNGSRNQWWSGWPFNRDPGGGWPPIFLLRGKWQTGRGFYFCTGARPFASLQQCLSNISSTDSPHKLQARKGKV